MSDLYISNLPEFCEALTQFAAVWQAGRDTPLDAILIDQANKLDNSDFGAGNRGLYQEACAIAPSEDELMGLPEKLGWRIKRQSGPIFTQATALARYRRGKKKGQYKVDKRGRIRHSPLGAEGEINRRIRHRFYQATGWLTPRLSKYAPLPSGVDRAGVVIQQEGGIISCVITNFSTMAGEVAERTGYLARAITNRERDMGAYIMRKFDELRTDLQSTHLPPPH